MTSPDPSKIDEAGVSRSLGYLTDNSIEVQNVSLAIYRRLAEAAPISCDEIARDLGVDAQSVSDRINLFPPSAIDFDFHGRVVGFIGLSLEPANHHIRVRGKTLFTWCAFDALFLSEILGSDITVQTRCRASNSEITVSVTPTGIASSNPLDVVMSVVTPDAASCRNDLRSAFCNHVNFFESEAAFRTWARGKSGVSCVDLAEAFAMGQSRNRMRFPDVEYLA